MGQDGVEPPMFTIKVRDLQSRALATELLTPKKMPVFPGCIGCFYFVHNRLKAMASRDISGHFYIATAPAHRLPFSHTSDSQTVRLNSNIWVINLGDGGTAGVFCELPLGPPFVAVNSYASIETTRRTFTVQELFVIGYTLVGGPQCRKSQNK